jgi:cytochrome bd-type quinol oxidase subunit 2
MTTEKQIDRPRSTIASTIACLPGIFSLLFGYWLMPSLRHAFPSLPDDVRHLVSQIDKHLIAIVAIQFCFTTAALIYQSRSQLTPLERVFNFINWGFALLSGFVLLTIIFGISFLPTPG